MEIIIKKSISVWSVTLEKSLISLYSKEDKFILRGVDVNTKNERKDAPVKPYDDSLWDRYSMYDRMPYVWDPDLNVEKIFTRVTGNVIKAYRCKINEPYEVKHE